MSQPSGRADRAGYEAGSAAFDTLFLGLGAVALLAKLRRSRGGQHHGHLRPGAADQEIGLRRALGATRGQIRAQFLADAILLALAGGIAGVIIGAAITAVYARAKGWAIVIPPEAWRAAVSAAAVIIGALMPACCPPSARPACPPPEALWAI